jgi:hypothetical protein
VADEDAQCPQGAQPTDLPQHLSAAVLFRHFSAVKPVGRRPWSAKSKACAEYALVKTRRFRLDESCMPPPKPGPILNRL